MISRLLGPSDVEWFEKGGGTVILTCPRPYDLAFDAGRRRVNYQVFGANFNEHRHPERITWIRNWAWE